MSNGEVMNAIAKNGHGRNGSGPEDRSHSQNNQYTVSVSNHQSKPPPISSEYFPRPHPPYHPSHEGQPLLHKYPSDQEAGRYKWHDDEEEDDDEASEAERREACRGMTLVAVVLFSILIGLRYLTAGLGQHPSITTTTATTGPPVASKEVGHTCPYGICENAHPKVSTKKQGFPSYWNYARGGPMNVTYDGRSFLVNGNRAIFLSGSIHPIRATKETWEIGLDEAVHNGLNMITIYVFWAEHQPFPDQDIDWTLPAGKSHVCELTNAPSYCGWSLADAIRSAASRGLFVHARIGP